MKLFVAIIFLSVFGHGADFIEINQEGVSEFKSRTKARKDILESAIEKASYDLVGRLIGEEKALKNKSLIDAKIVKNHLKYIPLSKVTNFKKAEEGTKADVQLKISLEDLKQLLLGVGLLYEMGGAPRVVPFVSISDRVNSKSFSWWNQDKSKESRDLQDWLVHFHGKVKKEFWKKGFWSIDPVNTEFKLGIPNVLKSERPMTSDYMLLGQFFDSSIVIRGEIKLARSESFAEQFRIDAQLEALQSSNGRVIGQVIRSFETEPGPFKAVVNKRILAVNESLAKDLVVQVLASWKKGTFGSSLIQLTLNGPLDFRQTQKIKKQILKNFREVRTLRERFFAPNEITYEMDSSITTSELASRFRRQKFDQFKVEIDDVSSNRLALNVKKR